MPSPHPDSRALRRDRTRRERIRDRIAADPTLTSTAKAVAGELLRYSDRSAKPCWPAVQTVAGKLGLCRRTIQLATAELAAAGVLRKIVRPQAARRNATNLYYWCSPPPPDELAECRPGQRRRCRCGVGGGHPRPRGMACSHRAKPTAPDPEGSLTSLPVEGAAITKAPPHSIKKPLTGTAHARTYCGECEAGFREEPDGTFTRCLCW
jgi:hypothetical protein